MKKTIIITGLLFAALFVQAATITINSSASGNVDWNSAIWGDPAAVATNGNDYVHDDSSAAVLLGLGTYGSFAGDSLTMDAGTVFYSKGGGSLGGTMILNGGQWQTRSAGTAIVLGSIRVTAASTMLIVDGNLQLNTGLSSTQNAVLTLQNFVNAGKSMVINATDLGFMGTFSAKDSGNAAVTWSLRFDRSFPYATLKVEGQKNDAAYASVYQLTNDVQFAAVKMPNGSGGLVTLSEGVYDGAALAAAGVSSDYYNDLGGTLEVLGDQIPINASATGNVDWNSAIWGDPAAVPTSGNEYVHDGSVSATLLGFGGTYGSFAGDRLTLDSGAVLFGKGGGATGGAIYLNGGQWQTRSAGTAIILGNVRVTENSSILLVDGNMELRTGLSSDSAAVLTIGNYSQAGRSMLINAVDSGFAGTFSISDSGLNPYTWTIRFEESYTNATLRIEGSKNDATYAAIYQLTNTIRFADVLMPDGSGGLVTLSPGTYDAAALATAGVSSDYYNDLGGVIQVGPPPPAYGYESWADDWGVDIGTSTNDYDGDQYNNFYEYVFNGDPTNAAVYGDGLVLDAATGGLICIYVQRDDTNLVYTLETAEDLITPAWTNSGYTVIGTNVTGGVYDYITNSISLSAQQSFVRLRVEQQ